MITYGRQFIHRKDISAVIKTLKSDWITQGPKIIEFENKLKRYLGAKYCTVVSNGTMALYLLAKALAWKKKDIILCSPISFLAASNSVLLQGATPYFVDVNFESGNMNVSLVNKVLKKYNKRVKAIIVTDYGGLPADWKELRKIKKRYGVKLINDNCHALGGSYYGDKKYASKYADYVIQSFHAVKNITTGEGGAVLTNDKHVTKKIKFLANHGVKKSGFSSPWIYQMQDLGYNARITDIQCALGISQLTRIDKIIQKKRKIAKLYDKYLQNINCISTPKQFKNKKSALHLYPIKIDFKKLKITKTHFFKIMKKNKINLQVHYIPIYKHPYYQNYCKTRESDLNSSREFYNQVLSLPLHLNISQRDIYYIIKIIKKIVQKYTIKKFL